MNRILDTRRPLGRFFCCLISVLLAVLTADAAGPATTSVTDTVYRADGTPAAGTLVIAWNAFTTPEGKAVPAGRLTVKIGAQGAVSIPLVPNFGATPEGSYYKVTYKLDDGTTSQEYWSVPAAPATTIAAIRSKLVPASVAVQYATRQYVDSALASLGGGGGGGSGNAVQIQGKDVDAALPTRGQALVFDGTKYKPVSHAEVDVVRDCGAKGDGITDDGPTLQTCINSHPGKTIFFPTTSASVSGGGTLTNPSYYSSQTLTMSGNNQRLTGDTGGMWSGGAAIRFAGGVTGIRVPSNCYSCKVEHLELQSPDAVATSANGIYVQGGHVRLSDLVVTGFGNNCIEIDGATSNANSWRASYILMNACKARGWYAHGMDANAGIALALFGRANSTVDIEDGAAYHNLYLASETETGAPVHYKDTAGGGAIWIGSYMEGAQPSAISGMVFGGNMVVATGNPYAQLWNIGNGNGVGVGSQTYWEAWAQANMDTAPSMRSGLTQDVTTTLRWLSNTGTLKWGIRSIPSTPDTFQIYDQAYGNWKMRFWAGNNQNTELLASGNGALLLNYTDGTGGVKFGSGAGTIVGSVSSAGLGTFNGGVTTPQQLTSTVATGTAPLVVSSATNVPNLNASSLNGATFAAPGPIGSATPAAGTFTALGLPNGAAPSLAANAFNLYAPTSISAAYGWMLPSAENAAGGYLYVGAASSHRSALSVQPDIRTISFAFGDVTNSSALTTSELAYVVVPYSCTITGWSLIVDSGTATVKFLDVAAGTAVPTLAGNSINTSGVGVSSGTVIESSTLTDFTATAIAAGDIVGVAITNVTTAKFLNAQLKCAR